MGELPHVPVPPRPEARLLTSSEEDTMTEQRTPDLERIVDRHYEQVNTDDFSDAAEVFTDDVVTETPGTGRLSGIDAFLAYSAGFRRAFPDGRIHRDRYLESGDTAVVEGRYTGTNTGPLGSPAGELPATGRAMVLPFADVFRIVEGRIAEHRVYYDSAAMLGQLGLLPEPASA
jgi:steroid delta-isomerase-like uncharacterized protein